MGLIINFEAWKQYESSFGSDINLLSNKSTSLEGNIKLYGLGVPPEYYGRGFGFPRLSKDKINELIGEVDKNSFSILLGHAPDFIEGYTGWGADLSLAGHFHGGMVRLPIVGGVISPRLLLFPKYDYGLYIHNSKREIVTNGLGQHSIKLRLNNIPEIVQAELQDYLSKGGEFICSVNFTDSNSTETYSNLNVVLNSVNINIDPYVIKDNDVNYMLDDSGYNSLVAINNAFLALSSDFDTYYQFKGSYMRPIRILNESSNEIYSVAIGGTSENAICVKVAENGVTQYGEAGRYYPAVFSASSGSDSTAQVIVFGSTDFTSDSYISSYGMNDDNVRFFKDCVRFLLGNDTNTAVEVPSRGISDYKLDGSKVTETSKTVVLTVFMITVPLVFLVAATVVYEKRKNL